MSPEQTALAVVWKYKRFWLIQSLALASWTALALSWFWLPDSEVWGIALAVVQGLVVILSGVWLIRKAIVFYRQAHAPSGERLGARFFLDLALLAVIGVYLPYRLIGWHPVLPGVGLQTGSLIVRFGAAYLLAVSAWLVLASLLAAARARSS